MSIWITPVTDRTDGTAMMTAVDMNRITGNIDYLFDYATAEGLSPSGSTVPKTSWTKNDIIERSTWEAMLTTLANIMAAVFYVPEVEPDYAMDWENMNNIETISYNLYNIIGSSGSQGNNNHYAGDPIFAGDDINVGGTYTP